jgi:hypothetical protein
MLDVMGRPFERVCPAAGTWSVLLTWPDGICGASHVHSAVDSPYLSGDVGGGISGKEMHDARDLFGAAQSNTRDFRCLRRSGLLLLSCSVLVFESGFVVPLPECGHGFVPCRGGGRRAVPRSAAPAGGAVSPSWRVPAAAVGQEKPGANMVTCGFPVTVCLVAVACRNFGPAFRARFEWRCLPGTFRVCRAARAAASPATAIASSDDVAVSWEDVMERIACRQTARGALWVS